MKIFGYTIEKRKEQQTPQTLEYIKPLSSDSLLFGQFSDMGTARNLSAVYRAVEIISDSIAILPIKVKNKNQKHKEDITYHPINLLFQNDPDTLMSKYNLIKLMIQNVLLNGNGFALIDRAEDGTPIDLYYLSPNDVMIHYDKMNMDLYYTCTLLPNVKILPKDIIHLKKNTLDGVTGVSVLTYASRTINISTNTENAAKSYFEKGCNLSGILTVQGPLQDHQREDIRNSWRTSFTDGGNGVCIIPGNMTYQPVQMNASDSQMIESRLFNIQDIARFFGLSPVMLGDLSHSSYSTLEATQNQFILNTLQPYIVMIEEEFSRKLLKDSESDFVVNFDETYLLKTDKTQEASYYQTLLNCGVLCVNEVRANMGFSPIDGGDKHIIPYTNLEDNTLNKNTNNDKNISDVKEDNE